MDDSKWFVYVLESETTGRYYYGYTNNPARRLNEHNTNHTRSTRNRGPWRLVWLRRFAEMFEFVLFESRQTQRLIVCITSASYEQVVLFYCLRENSRIDVPVVGIVPFDCIE